MRLSGLAKRDVLVALRRGRLYDQSPAAVTAWLRELDTREVKHWNRRRPRVQRDRARRSRDGKWEPARWRSDDASRDPGVDEAS